MKRQIRFGVFETNSSSTHSLSMCSQEDYDRWANGEVFLNDGWGSKEQFITKEDAMQYLKENDYEYDNEDELAEMLRDCEFYTMNDYFDNDYLEGFDDSFTTANGDKVVAFGRYGMNG